MGKIDYTVVFTSCFINKTKQEGKVKYSLLKHLQVAKSFTTAGLVLSIFHCANICYQ